jgi:hypothetical protein
MGHKLQMECKQANGAWPLHGREAQEEMHEIAGRGETSAEDA